MAHTITHADWAEVRESLKREHPTLFRLWFQFLRLGEGANTSRTRLLVATHTTAGYVQRNLLSPVYEAFEQIGYRIHRITVECAESLLSYQLSLGHTTPTALGTQTTSEPTANRGDRKPQLPQNRFVQKLFKHVHEAFPAATAEDIPSTRYVGDIKDARLAVVWLAKEYTDCSVRELAEMLSRSEASFYSLQRQAQTKYAENPVFRNRVGMLFQLARQ